MRPNHTLLTALNNNEGTPYSKDIQTGHKKCR